MNTITIPHLAQFTGGIPLLDLRFNGYNLSEVIELMERLGPEGRSYYLFPQLMLDFFYPILFSVGYSMAIFQMRATNKSLAFGGIISCLLGGIFDLLENYCTWSGLMNFPEIKSMIVKIGSIATTLKFGFSTLGLLVFFVLLASVLKPRLHCKSLKNKTL